MLKSAYTIAGFFYRNYDNLPKCLDLRKNKKQWRHPGIRVIGSYSPMMCISENSFSITNEPASNAMLPSSRLSLST